MTELDIAVIAASIRGERMGRVLADWAVTAVADRIGKPELIDLAECDLPGDDLLQPGGGRPTAISERLDRSRRPWPWA
jgi:hypothetical protein